MKGTFPLVPKLCLGTREIRVAKVNFVPKQSLGTRWDEMETLIMQTLRRFRTFARFVQDKENPVRLLTGRDFRFN